MMAESESGADRPALKRRHVAAATIGNALEFYDFLTYAFFSIQIGHVRLRMVQRWGAEQHRGAIVTSTVKCHGSREGCCH
jgi:hypothetical protein